MANGQKDDTWTASVDITSIEDPKVFPVIDAFTVEPADASVGGTIVFTCTAHDPDGQIISYALDFGDGDSDTSSTSGSFSHQYQTSGTFKASCAVTDNDGKHHHFQRQIRSNSAPGKPIPRDRRFHGKSPLRIRSPDGELHLHGHGPRTEPWSATSSLTATADPTQTPPGPSSIPTPVPAPSAPNARPRTMTGPRPPQGSKPSRLHHGRTNPP